MSAQVYVNGIPAFIHSDTYNLSYQARRRSAVPLSGSDFLKNGFAIFLEGRSGGATPYEALGGSLYIHLSARSVCKSPFCLSSVGEGLGGIS